MASSQDAWKNWLIASLWSVSLLLAAAGYHSIKESLDKVHAYQAAELQDRAAWKIEYEKQRAIIWRTLDRLCGYQSERLLREGKVPDYSIRDIK